MVCCYLPCAGASVCVPWLCMNLCSWSSVFFFFHDCHLCRQIPPNHQDSSGMWTLWYQNALGRWPAYSPNSSCNSGGKRGELLVHFSHSSWQQYCPWIPWIRRVCCLVVDICSQSAPAIRRLSDFWQVMIPLLASVRWPRFPILFETDFDHVQSLKCLFFLFPSSSLCNHMIGRKTSIKKVLLLSFLSFFSALFYKRNIRSSLSNIFSLSFIQTDSGNVWVLFFSIEKTPEIQLSEGRQEFIGILF